MTETSVIESTPISTSTTVVSERSFRVVCLRPDFRDALTQLLSLVNQAHDERLTGQVTINFGQGGVTSVVIRESKKIP